MFFGLRSGHSANNPSTNNLKYTSYNVDVVLCVYYLLHRKKKQFTRNILKQDSKKYDF